MAAPYFSLSNLISLLKTVNSVEIAHDENYRRKAFVSKSILKTRSQTREKGAALVQSADRWTLDQRAEVRAKDLNLHFFGPGVCKISQWPNVLDCSIEVMLRMVRK